jgi:hypothetical protein
MTLGFVKHITRWHSTSSGGTTFVHTGHLIPKMTKSFSVFWHINSNNKKVTAFFSHIENHDFEDCEVLTRYTMHLIITHKKHQD